MTGWDKMNDGYAFRFAGEAFIARPSGALWWPGRRMLVVADLHLGRAERFARRGGALLPPFDVPDTLARLAAEISALEPEQVVSLGDAFDDDLAAVHLSDRDSATLAELARGRGWLWVAGNHDPGTRAHDRLRGTFAAELPGAVSLRHIAAKGPDISGHMHPSTQLAGRRFRCFVIGRDHLILPAFGSFTGGLDIGHPAFAPLAAGGIALACAARVFALPVPHGRGSSPPKKAKIRSNT